MTAHPNSLLARWYESDWPLALDGGREAGSDWFFAELDDEADEDKTTALDEDEIVDDVDHALERRAGHE